MIENLKVKQSIIEIGKRLYDRNLLAGADGNISYRESDSQIWITPSGKPKGFLQKSDIALITIDDRVLQGNPSSERLLHLEVYKKCPEAKCVVHAHPPTAIAWTIAYPNLDELPNDTMSEVILAMGRVPIVPYAKPGTIDMGTTLHPYLPQCRNMLLARHGALSWGEDFEEATNGMERIEHISLILKNALELGGLTSLPEKELGDLWKIREKIGNRTL